MINDLASYPAYKDSGLPWLGDVPEHWRLKRLKFLARVTSGQVDPRSPEQRSKILIAPNHIKSGTGRIILEETAEEQGADSGKYEVRRGQVVYSKIRPNLRKAAIARVDCLCSADMYPLTVYENELRPDFLLLLLLSVPFTRFVVDCSLRVAMPKVNREALGEGWLWYPDLKEQQTIVRYLDYMDLHIRHYIRTKQKLANLLIEQKQAIVQRAVTRGLHAEVPLKASGMDWLGDVPEHWDLQRNGRLFTQRNEMGFADLPILEVSLKTGVRIRDFTTSDRKQVMSDRSKYKRAVKGDIAYNTMRIWQGAAGVAPVDGLVSPAYVVAKPLEGTEPRYFGYLFRTPAYMGEVDCCSRGIVKDRNRLYWEDFKQMPPPFPPMAEQVEIADAIDRDTSTIDEAIDRALREIALINEYRTRLITDVVTGKLDVSAVAASLPDEISLEEMVIDEAEPSLQEQLDDDWDLQPAPEEVEL